jgi:hypothetical protein
VPKRILKLSDDHVKNHSEKKGCDANCDYNWVKLDLLIPRDADNGEKNSRGVAQLMDGKKREKVTRTN